MREHFERQGRTQHREAWELLPWFVNGSLSDSQAQRLEDHLEKCPECRCEYQEQLLIREQMQSQEVVLYAPHASLRKLLARIGQDEIAAPAESDGHAAPPAARRMKWLTFAVAAEALGLIVLVGVLSWRFEYERSAPRYSTLSSAPAVIPQRLAARVVFSPSISLAKLGELLRSYDAQVIAGPSDAGVYTLVFPAALDQKDVAAVVTRLRANPEVRFAELAVADFGAGT